MQLPFSSEQFYQTLRAYNEALWPAQVLLVGLAAAAVALVRTPRPWSGRAISGILGFLWAWLALAYHLAFFTRINPLAYAFAAVSCAAALVFFWHGVVHRRLRFMWTGGIRAASGVALLVFSLLVYPLWSWAAGHAYPAMATFGLPCPTTIFTIGMLAFVAPPYPLSPLVVPVLWCLVGAQAAFLLGVPQDLGLIVAGLVGLALLARSGALGVRS